jgi:hypothetical protein
MMRRSGRYRGAARSLLCFAAVIGLTACEPSGGVSVRYIIESSSGSGVRVRVFMEGSGGQSVDGALVVAVSPADEAMVLGYDYQEGCYAGELASVIAGDYAVSVRSRLLRDGAAAKTIRHVPLTEAPAITGLADDTGSDALLGGSPRADRCMSVSWSEVPGATASALHIVEGATERWSASTGETNVIVPSEALEAGTYGFRVAAQCISGDPLFESEDYYSASEASGSTRYATLR